MMKLFIFSNKTNTTDMGKETVQVNDIVRIPSSAFFKGELRSESDARVDGIFEGVLHSKGRVILGENARVSGTVLADTVEIQGNFTGDVYSCNVVILRSTAVYKGSCNTVKISIDLGANFTAQCNMITVEEYKKTLAGICPDMQVSGGKGRQNDAARDQKEHVSDQERK